MIGGDPSDMNKNNMRTKLEIDGDKFLINGKLTYQAQGFEEKSIMSMITTSVLPTNRTERSVRRILNV